MVTITGIKKEKVLEVIRRNKKMKEYTIEEKARHIKEMVRELENYAYDLGLEMAIDLEEGALVFIQQDEKAFGIKLDIIVPMEEI